MDKDETNCEYVGSRGILKTCNSHSANPRSSIRFVRDQSFEQLKDGDSIYICSNALQDFVLNRLAAINTRFVIVSGDADNPVPTGALSRDAFERLYNHPMLIAWYSQNLVFSPKQFPKLRYLPIGLDYHTLSEGAHAWGPMSSPIQQESLLKSIANTARPFWERIPSAYTTFHFELGRGGRREAFEKISSPLVHYEPNRVVRMISWRNQSKYAFVVSPPGEGLDCHRTWEALCLGCIPILLSSPLDDLFEDLPVLIISSWTDLSRDLLYKTMLEYKNREFKMEKLNLSYWTNQILRMA